MFVMSKTSLSTVSIGSGVTEKFQYANMSTSGDPPAPWAGWGVAKVHHTWVSRLNSLELQTSRPTQAQLSQRSQCFHSPTGRIEKLPVH